MISCTKKSVEARWPRCSYKSWRLPRSLLLSEARAFNRVSLLPACMQTKQSCEQHTRNATLPSGFYRPSELTWLLLPKLAIKHIISRRNSVLLQKYLTPCSQKWSKKVVGAKPFLSNEHIKRLLCYYSAVLSLITQQGAFTADVKELNFASNTPRVLCETAQ